MTKIKTKHLGEDVELAQLPSHFIGEAFDEFIVSDNISSILTCLIKLSIGLETYIKSMLHGKDPKLITHLDWNRWNAIKPLISGSTKKDARITITNEISQKSELSRTLDYGIALELFPIFYRVSKKVIQDLSDLKDYRNGLFHWKADTASEYKLSKQALRIFNWINTFIKKKNKHWLGEEFNIIDPMGDRRRNLRKIEDAMKNEVAFIVQRKIFKHNREASIYHQIKARLDGLVFIPDAVNWSGQSCPACGYKEMQLYESGSKRDGEWENRYIFANCLMCDLTISNLEFEEIKSDGFPSLLEIFESGGNIA